MNWTATGAVLMGLAVILGAFGAHVLKSHLDAYLLGIYERAVFYHFVHALGLLLVAALAKSGAVAASSASWVCILLAAGILLFSGSLYVLALTGVRALGAVTPFGGISFIAAWAILACAAIRAK